MTSMVLPTSPRTIRLAINGMKAMAIENTMLAIARRITSPEPKKLFIMPFAFNTALRLPMFTAVISAWRIA
jgi:hypothetical protein